MQVYTWKNITPVCSVGKQTFRVSIIFKRKISLYVYCKMLCLCLNAPVATWGQLSRVSCEDLPPPASLRHSPVSSALSAPTARTSAASTPHWNYCEHRYAEIVHFPYRLLTGLWTVACAICWAAHHWMDSKYYLSSAVEMSQNMSPCIFEGKVTYFSLNTSSLRLSLSFSNSLLRWRQKGKCIKNTKHTLHGHLKM